MGLNGIFEIMSVWSPWKQAYPRIIQTRAPDEVDFLVLRITLRQFLFFFDKNILYDPSLEQSWRNSSNEDHNLCLYGET